MYLAFHIAPEQENPKARIIICKPMVAKPAVAWAVLRSALHETRTGGILAGTEECMKAVLSAIDQREEGWPNDPDRMVAAITQLASRLGCEVIFKQNLEPENKPSNDLLQGPIDVTETDTEASLSWSWVGPESAIQDYAVELLSHPTVSSTLVGANRILARTTVHAAPTKDRQDGEGRSLEYRQLPFADMAEVLELMLNKAHHFKFCLLVREATHSIVFLGTKPASTIRDGLARYEEHLKSEQPAAAEPKEGEEPVELPEIKVPAVGNCKFWRIR